MMRKSFRFASIAFNRIGFWRSGGFRRRRPDLLFQAEFYSRVTRLGRIIHAGWSTRPYAAATLPWAA